MKVGIIGASGFIGTRLVERFCLGGVAEPVAVVRQACSLARPSRFAIETRVASALDPAEIANALDGCAAVVHTAIGDPGQIERMPAALCRGAAAAGVRRVVYLSSASVHGQNPAPGTDEASPLDAHQGIAYNNAKVRAEQRFFAACRRFGLSGFALRPGIVYGPRSRWIADLAAELLEGRAWLHAGGRGICNAIYADNLAGAVDACLGAGDDAAGAYLVGDSETVTWADFHHAAADALGCPRSEIRAVSRLPAFRSSWSERGRSAAANPVIRRLLPFVPSGLKRGTKAVLAASSAGAAADSWTLRTRPLPRITAEMALLQQCAWKFPHTRAERRLGYRPAVTFAEGMDRSFAWWRFAQGRFAVET